MTTLSCFEDGLVLLIALLLRVIVQLTQQRVRQPIEIIYPFYHLNEVVFELVLVSAHHMIL